MQGRGVCGGHKHPGPAVLGGLKATGRSGYGARSAAAHPGLAPWFHLAARRRQIHLSKLGCKEPV